MADKDTDDNGNGYEFRDAADFFAAQPEYTEEQAACEAARCLDCKNPRCVAGCPAGVPVPEFIKLIKQGDYINAVKIIREKNCFPSICGRVCQQEKQCEKNCVRGIKGSPVNVGQLETFAAAKFIDDYIAAGAKGENERMIKEFSPFADAAPENGFKAALIGAGPTSMACGTELLKRGYGVTFFEASDFLGGVPAVGIPEFRLPHKVIAFEFDLLKKAGAEFITNSALGRDFAMDDLFNRGFDAVYIGCGLGRTVSLGIKGDDADFVLPANEFLTDVNTSIKFGVKQKINLKDKRVAVIGGGNVAMDAARCAKKAGAESVDILYRRTEKEIPACIREIEEAKREQIVFNYLAAPSEIIKNEDGQVCALKCIKMTLGEPDKSGRARPVPLEGSEYTIDCGCVIYAIGETGNLNVSDGSGQIEMDENGFIGVDQNFRTARRGVFAGGDVVTGAATVISAVMSGMAAAEAIDRYVKDLNKQNL